MSDETKADARARGIDVNHYHSPQDWPAVFASGISFVGIKATQGTGFVDPKLEDHRANAGAAATAVLLYHYADADPDTVAQARHFCDALDSLAPHELPVLDLERKPDGPAPFLGDVANTAEMFRRVRAWIFTVEDRLGVRPLLYTRRCWIDSGNPYPAWANNVDLWVPRYRSLELGPGTLPRSWGPARWTFWQWSDGTTPPSSVPGVGPVDSNVFNGTEAELAAYVAAVDRPRVA